MLESKLPLAGNITATLAGGVLTLTGDAQPNGWLLTGGAAGVVQVQGVGTTVNFLRQVNFTGVTNINLVDNGGSDSFVANNLTLTGSINAAFDFAGIGNDVVNLSNVNVGADLIIDTDNNTGSADVISLFAITVGDDLQVDAGSPTATAVLPDVITARQVTINNNNAAGVSFFATGNGPDAVSLANLSVNGNGNLFVDTSPLFGASNAPDALTLANATIAGLLNINLDDFGTRNVAGADAAVLTNVTAGHLSLDAGGGSDVVSIVGSSFGTGALGAANLDNSITVGGNAGFEVNVVTIATSNFFGGLNFAGSAGRDIVNVSTSQFVGPAAGGVHTQFNLNDGNDSLLLVSCIFDAVNRVTLSGGNGFDTFFGGLNRNTLGATVAFPRVADFEIFTSF